jgi:hypothetical protein
MAMERLILLAEDGESRKIVVASGGRGVRRAGERGAAGKGFKSAQDKGSRRRPRPF